MYLLAPTNDIIIYNFHVPTSWPLLMYKTFKESLKQVQSNKGMSILDKQGMSILDKSIYPTNKIFSEKPFI